MASNPQQQQSSSMSSSPSPLVWFQLFDSATEEPYKGTTADAVSLFPGSVVVQFRDAVKAKNSSILTGITSSQLIVYKNKAAFDKRNAAVDEGKETCSSSRSDTREDEIAGITDCIRRAIVRPYH